jgi:hypothetical protein
MRSRFAIGASTLAMLSIASAQTVSVRNGNIYLADATGQARALTSSGLDEQPVISPDKRWIVFVRDTPGKTIPTGSDNSPAKELWQVRADGRNATLLLRGKSSEKVENILANFSKLQFSPDGRDVFFLSDAWATSGAVHVVDTTNSKEHFVCSGSDLEVIFKGEYAGCLLVLQHHYFIGGGSYDWYWLLRPDGKEIGPVGETTENFKATYLSD